MDIDEHLLDTLRLWSDIVTPLPIIQTTPLAVVRQQRLQQLSEEVLLDRYNQLALLDQTMLNCQRLKRPMLQLMLAEELWEHLLFEHHTVVIQL
jgi:hypothetical protein